MLLVEFLMLAKVHSVIRVRMLFYVGENVVSKTNYDEPELHIRIIRLF